MPVEQTTRSDSGVQAPARKIKRADHPLTARLVLTMPSGREEIQKIPVRLSGGILRMRRPKWIARWESWHVWDSGWMKLCENDYGGWQTEERARQVAKEREMDDARWEAAVVRYRNSA